MSISKLINNFSALSASESCIFILRHAEKVIASNMHADLDSTLTVNGIKSSRELGCVLHSLYPKVGVVRSSPIARCLGTAKNIFLEYPQNIVVAPDSDLGGDGIYVSDNILAAQHFLKDPSRKDIFIRMQAGDIFAGMRDVKTGTKLLLTKIMQDLKSFTVPSFYITHDSILALFVGTMIHQVVDETNWFKYLDGICIKIIDNKVNLYWEEESFDITWGK